MTDNQIFQVFGIVYSAVGLGMLLNPTYYKKLFMEFKTSSAVMYFGGLFALGIGFIIVRFHNFWSMELSIIITIVGWLALVKGITILVLPQMMAKTIDIFINAKNNVFMIQAIFVIALGVLFCWLGFFI